jgi:hypothetical protein
MVLAGVLFSGCTKDSMDTLDSTAITNGNTARKNIAVPPMIIYNLAATPVMYGRQMQWNNGYITVGALILEGTHINGDMISMEKFETSTNITVQLFAPVALGTLTTQPDTFNYGMFTIQLNPGNSIYSVNSVDRTNSVNPANSPAAFFLSGNFYMNDIRRVGGVGIPVQVIINEKVLLSANWIKNITISDFKTYTATLSLNLNNLTDNITPEMFMDAQKTDGTIFITNTSNQNLYGIMMTNLQNDMLQAQFSLYPPVINPNPTSIPIAATPPNS